MFVRAEPAYDEGADALLSAAAPAVKAWLDLQIPRQNLEEWDAPESLQRVRELMDRLPVLRLVSDDLDRTV
jgi:hypothetical protein